jgi:glycosyltransferase involved in cell wall biosynthesis
MNKVSLVVITDGRQACISQTIPSMRKNLNYDFHEKIIVNDSGDPRYHQYLVSSYPDFRVVSHETRRGLAGAVQSAWSSISRDSDYVFHLEDDFLFNQPIDIEDMISLLRCNSYLVQMALVRASVNPPEEEVGGFVFQHLEDYTQKDGFFEHGRLFTLNPCLYPMSTVRMGWPDHGGESEFTSKVHSLNCNYRFGFYGNIYDRPYVTHIGGRRSEGWFL